MKIKTKILITLAILVLMDMVVLLSLDNTTIIYNILSTIGDYLLLSIGVVGIVKVWEQSK